MLNHVDNVFCPYQFTPNLIQIQFEMEFFFPITARPENSCPDFNIMYCVVRLIAMVQPWNSIS